MGFIDSLLLDWRATLSTLRTDDSRTLLTAAAVTVLAISLTITLVRKSRQSSFAAIMLESHVIGMMLEKKDGWLSSILVNPTALIHGLSSNRAIIVEPSLGQTILRRQQEVLNNDPMQWALQVRVFGSRDSLHDTVKPIMRSLFGAISRNLLAEVAVKPVVRATNVLLGEKMIDLVPSLSKPGPMPAAEVDKRPWLRAADSVIEADGTVSLDLYTTVRDFTMYVSTRILGGTDLVKVYPEIIPDLFALDAGFGLLGLGFPTWLPIGIIQRAVTARNRMVKGLSAFAERLEAVATGTADEELKKRMADVNPMFFDRSALYRGEKMVVEDRATMDVALIWAMNGNTSPAIFWNLAYLVTRPDALAAVRDEVAPYIGLASAPGSKEDASVDVDALVYRCPRLKASFLETMRLASEPSSIRHIAQDFHVANPSSKSPFSFRRGAHLTVAHTVHQRDADAFPEPDAFRPERFLTLAEGEGKSESAKYIHSMSEHKDDDLRVSYRTLKPWGDGALSCKGRLFAEREMLVATALFITAWDVEMLDAEKKVPNHLPGTGVVKPDRAMRVKIRRRAQSGAA